MSMNLNTKRSRKGKKFSLCDLPDDVLVHILSFIPTVDSVATCILSTRWSHLWKHVPKLSFDEKHRTRKSHNVEFGNMVSRVLRLHAARKLEKLSLSCCNHELYDVRKWVHDSIMKNIQSLDLCIYYDQLYDRALIFELPESLFTCKTLEALKLQGHILVVLPTVIRLPKLKKVELVGVKYLNNGKEDRSGKLFISSCSSLESLVVEADRADNYIGFHTISSSTLRVVEFRLGRTRSLIGYNPQIFCTALRQLNLKNRSANKIKVPSNVFTCETLELLVLDGYFVICGATTICLPNLTFLALRRVEYGDDVVLNELISCSTSLESLDLEQSSELKAELHISSCTLKDIKVRLCCLSSSAGKKVVIKAPTLKYLKLNSSGRVVYHIQYLPSLEYAEVIIGLDQNAYDDCSSCTSLTNVYQALQHVKNLKIYQNHSMDCALKHHPLPMFNRLTELDITIHRRRYGMLRELIENSTKLENLALCVIPEDLTWRERSDKNHWKNPNSVPACLLTSLTSMSISSFKGRGDELKMIKYILRNARILEKMEVSLYSLLRYDKRQEWETVKILNIRQASEKCVVLIK